MASAQHPSGQCPGPLLWFDVPADDTHLPAAVIECATCGMVQATGQPFEARHQGTELLRSPA